MENLIFEGNNVTKIGRAFRNDTAYEHGYITRFECAKLNEIGDKHGLELHYELHLNDNGEKFVRLCCHIKPYTEYANLTEAKLRLKLIKNGINPDEMLKKRADLRTAFNGANFVPGIEKIATRPNYIELIKRNLDSSTFNDAVKDSEAFIADTLNAVSDVLKTTLK